MIRITQKRRTPNGRAAKGKRRGEGGNGSKKRRARPDILLVGLTLLDSTGVMFDPKWRKKEVSTESCVLSESGRTSF